MTKANGSPPVCCSQHRNVSFVVIRFQTCVRV